MNSNQTLVVIDGSGSMNEWGKEDLIVNLIVTILQHSTPKFVVWNEKIEDLDVKNITSLELNFKGDAKLKVLYDYLEVNSFEKVILISDGHIKYDNSVNFCKFNCQSFACGVDSDISNLTAIFGVVSQEVYNILRYLNSIQQS